jgi:multidrug resistance protein
MSFANNPTIIGSATTTKHSTEEAGFEHTRDGRKDEVDATEDTNKVGWEGPDDPANPMNWPQWKKMTQVILLSVMTMMTSLATTMFAPGVARLMQDFNSTNANLGAFTVSVYVLGFAVAPLVIAPLSETYGRLGLYLGTCFIFIIFTMACALSKNMAMFIVFRLLAGCAGSAPLALGGGTISDLIRQEERGGAMAMYQIGPLLGPVIGPILGGFITEYVGWRWVFWVLTIAVSCSAFSITR